MKGNIKEARKALERARELASRGPSPFKGMTFQQVINQLRKTREELWREKLAQPSFSPRH